MWIKTPNGTLINTENVFSVKQDKNFENKVVIYASSYCETVDFESAEKAEEYLENFYDVVKILMRK